MIMPPQCLSSLIFLQKDKMLSLNLGATTRNMRSSCESVLPGPMVGQMLSRGEKTGKKMIN